MALRSIAFGLFLTIEISGCSKVKASKSVDTPPPPSATSVDIATTALAGIDGPALLAVESAPVVKLVYNAVFTTAQPGTLTDLADARIAHVSFFIDTPNSKSATDAASHAVSSEILAAKENLPLTVTMNCPFCQAPPVSSRSMVYLPNKGYSTYAEFDFTPLRKKLQGSSGVGQIGFLIYKEATRVDSVPVNVRIVADGQPSATVPIQQPHPSAAPSIELSSWQRPIDLKLTIRVDNSQRVQVSIVGSDEIERLFNGQNRQPDRSLKFLDTGLMATEIPKLASNFYKDLYAIIDGDSSLRQKLVGADPAVVPVINNLTLTESDQQALLRAFAKHGALWYHELFIIYADPALRKMIEMFGNYPSPDHPRRVQIESSGLYLPWQILIPSAAGDLDGTAFWGFRYELSVEPMSIAIPGPVRGPAAYAQGPLVYGKYASSIAGDVVGELAESERQAIEGDLRFPGVITVGSAKAFIDSLTQQRSALQMIVTFTHGQSGTVFADSGTVSEDAAGPKLIFSASEAALNVDDLNGLISNLPPDETYVFPRSPFVLLNGCETGTAGFFATTNQDFVGTFLRMGSSAVIATEAPVWTFFGYSFGLDLLRAIRSGAPVASALLTTRQQYLNQAKNPLGLIYSAFGEPDAAFVFQ